MIWRWFFPPLSLIVWSAVTFIISAFWFETRGFQQNAWALAFVVWILFTPYLAIFVSSVLTIITMGSGHPEIAEFYARMAVVITHFCVLPDALIDRFGFGSIVRITSIPSSLYANALLVNGKIQKAKVISQQIADKIGRVGTNGQKASSLVDLANLLLYGGDLLEARQKLTSALRLMEKEPKNTAWLLQQEKILRGLGDLHNACHDFPTAVKMYQLSIKTMEEALKSIKAPAMIAALNPLLAISSTSLAGVYVWMGDFEAAEESLRKIENKSSSVLAKIDTAQLVTLAELKIRQSKLAEAETLISAAAKITKGLGALLSLDVLRVRARLEMERDNLEASQQTLTSAFGITDKFLGDANPLNLDLLALQRDLFAKLNNTSRSEEFESKYESLKRHSQDRLYGRAALKTK